MPKQRHSRSDARELILHYTGFGSALFSSFTYWQVRRVLCTYGSGFINNRLHDRFHPYRRLSWQLAMRFWKSGA